MSTELIQAAPGFVAPAEKAATVDLLGLILTGLKSQSAEGYRKDFRDFARFARASSIDEALWGLLRLEQGQANAVVLAYLGELTARKLSPATISRRLSALGRAVHMAQVVGLTSIALHVEPPKAEAFRDTSGPGARGWQQLLESAAGAAGVSEPKPVRDLAIVLLLHDLGLRRGEAAALDYPDDLDADRPAVQILGKGRRAKEWLTINPRTRDALRAWIAIRGDWPGPLFTRCDRAAREARGRLSGWAINQLVGGLGDRAKVGRKVRAHGLRHQAITEALDAGWDVRDVKQFSRHGKIDTVLIYDDRRKDVAGQITRSIGGAARPRKRKP